MLNKNLLTTTVNKKNKFSSNVPKNLAYYRFEVFRNFKTFENTRLSIKLIP